MIRTLTAIAALTALAACNGGDTTADSAADTGKVSLTNASPDEVGRQAQAAGGMAFEPGQWTTNVEILDMDMPGMPKGPMRDQALKMMREQMHSVTRCVSKAEAKKPGEELFAGTDGQCRYDKFTMAGGRIDGTMTCNGADTGGEMTMRMNGTYSATGFDIINETQTRTPGAGVGAHMKMRVSGKRTGECTS